MRTPKILLILLLFCSCSTHKKVTLPASVQKLNNVHAYPLNAEPSHKIAFKKDATYGDTNKVLIGNIRSLAVSSMGRVFLGNPDKGFFFVYAPDGHYLTKLGGKGKGPGEFLYFSNPVILNHKLYARDPSQRRINIFSTDSLALVRTLNVGIANRDTINALQGYGVHSVYPRGNGTFLVQFTPKNIRKMGLVKLHQKYYYMNSKGKVLSHQIFEQKGIGHGLLLAHIGGQLRGGSFRFVPHSLFALGSNHHIFTAWSSRFLIKEYNPDGAYQQAIYYPFNKVRLTRKQAMNLQKQRGNSKYYQQVLQHNSIPKTWPALHSMMIDDQNRLWISTIVKNMKVYQWWVLSPKGKLLARFKWPRSKPIKKVKNGYIYTLEKNNKGVKRVVRYKIQMQ